MTAETRRDDRTDILGVGVSAITLDDAVDRIAGWIAERRPNYVCNGIMESQGDADLRAIHNKAGMVTPDGMPLVWLSRWFGRSQTRRVYGPDLMRKMTAVSARCGYRQFYYGGALGVAEKLEKVLSIIHSGLTVSGTLCPPFRALSAEEDEEVVRVINAARPDIVWVGLSTPKQEYWMSSHVGRLEAPVLIGVGAAFDFLAGTKRQAPVWTQNSSLEWLFRLCSEPRRLWRRYAYIVPGFVLLVARDVVMRAFAQTNPGTTIVHRHKRR